MRRRDFLGLAALPLAHTIQRQRIDSAHGAVVDSDGAPLEGLDLVRDFNAPFTTLRLVNRGATPRRVNDVVVFQTELTLPLETALYGEGFQMLSQTGGTVGPARHGSVHVVNLRGVDTGRRTGSAHRV